MAKDLIVIGNWKMYKTAREAVSYLEDLFPLVEGCKAKIFLAVPYTSIAPAARAAKGTEVTIGAQNMNDARDGAFTGEIAALMLKEAGAEFVLLGHSERRHKFQETDDLIARKVIRALQDDLIPVLCVGETERDREEGNTEQVLKEQIEASLQDIPKEDARKIILAYEPVWAIGTGKSATAEIAGEAHAFCRACLQDLFGKRVADAIPILYGGSVTVKNASTFTAEKEINGVLVGGASLDPATLAEIAQNCTAPPQKVKSKKVKKEA